MVFVRLSGLILATVVTFFGISSSAQDAAEKSEFRTSSVLIKLLNDPRIKQLEEEMKTQKLELVRVIDDEVLWRYQLIQYRLVFRDTYRHENTVEKKVRFYFKSFPGANANHDGKVLLEGEWDDKLVPNREDCKM